MEPMRISYLYHMAAPSRTAASIRIFNMCHALATSGVDVVVYTTEAAESTEACLTYYGLDVPKNLRIVPLLREHADASALRDEIPRALLAGPSPELDVVFIRDESGLRLLDHLDWPRGKGPRLVFEAHRLCFPRVEDPEQRKQVKQREAAAIARADGLVCVTSGLLDAMHVHFAPTCDTLVCPNGAPRGVPPPPEDPERDLDIVYVGKLLERKGVWDLVRAMRFLPDRHLHIVGGSVENEREQRQRNELERLARDTGVDGRVGFSGFLPPIEARSMLRRARVGVCPLPAGVSIIADRFTCPLKILEMMALGVPIVATAVPTIEAMLDHGRTALLAEPNAPRALAAAIERLLVDRPLALKLAATAKAQAGLQTWSHQASHLQGFLRSL